jgi:hypothetical protein
VTSLLAPIALVHAWGLSRSPGFGDDEGTYAAQAWAVLKLHRLSFYTYWYDHPPLGWLLLAAWAWLTRSFSRYSVAVVAGREAVLVCQLVSAGLLYVLARRLGFRRVFAAAAIIVFAFSPLGLYFHRMVFLDNIAIPFVIGSFVLALSLGRRLVAHAGAAACFALAVLVKETKPSPLAGSRHADVDRHRRPDPSVQPGSFRRHLRRHGRSLSAVCGIERRASPGEGHVSLVGSMVWQLFERPSSGSLFNPSSGTRSIVRWWLSMDPRLLIVSLSLVPAALLAKRLRPSAVALLVPLGALLRPGYVPAMQVILILPFAALVTAGIPDSLLSYVLQKPAGRHQTNESDASSSSDLRRRLSRGSAWVILVSIVFGSITAITPWRRGDAELLNGNQNAAYDEARVWILEHVPRDATMLVDSVFWLDLVEKGFHPVSVVWFYKLDLDPGIAKRFPHGWRDFDYVVASPVVRSVTPNLKGLVQVRDALKHSSVVAAFGSGDHRIEIRRVQTHSTA